MSQHPFPQDKYNTSVIRKLLTAAFSDEEFTIFCYDHFPNVYKEFTSGMVFSAKVHLLVDQCNRTNSFGDLLLLVKENYPYQYEIFKPSLQEMVKEGETQSDQQIGESLYKKSQLSSAIQIFISYSRKDIKMARQLAEDLQKAGFAVWWDVSDLKGGDSWGRTIQAALEASKICLVLLSPASVQSEWVEKEYLYAMELGLKIIPLLYRDCKKPLALINKQYIDFRDNYEQGLFGLFTALYTTIPNPRHPTLKDKLLAIFRNPMWQMIGVIVAIITFGWGVYIFYIDNYPAPPTVTPTHTTTTVALGPIPTNTPSRPQESDTPTPTKIPASPTFTRIPTETPVPPSIFTQTSTSTPSTPTSTSIPTSTSLPTSTNTPVVPTNTPSPTTPPLLPTNTQTAVAKTADVVSGSSCPEWFATPEPGKAVLVLENHYSREVQVELYQSYQDIQVFKVPAKQADEPVRIALQSYPGYFYSGEGNPSDPLPKLRVLIQDYNPGGYLEIQAGQIWALPLLDYRQAGIQKPAPYPLKIPSGCSYP